SKRKSKKIERQEEKRQGGVLLTGRGGVFFHRPKWLTFSPAIIQNNPQIKKIVNSFLSVDYSPPQDKRQLFTHIAVLWVHMARYVKSRLDNDQLIIPQLVRLSYVATLLSYQAGTIIAEALKVGTREGDRTQKSNAPDTPKAVKSSKNYSFFKKFYAKLSVKQKESDLQAAEKIQEMFREEAAKDKINFPPKKEGEEYRPPSTRWLTDKIAKLKNKSWQVGKT
ncbi:MAG: hypothetical protein HQK56_09690, partial [Deltaproteobacteria bacterium]|nr:hypothetical protein [Deltaproteobacteria bacterium]